jgi:glycopeptide antibiotics resistance protein
MSARDERRYDSRTRVDELQAQRKPGSGSDAKTRLFSAIILAAYGTFLIKLLVFKGELLDTELLTINFAGSSTGQVNLVPFRTIWPYLHGEPQWSIALINLVGNIALFVPIGFIVPFVYRRTTWRNSLALAVAFSLVIEGMQAVLRLGIFDVDDVMLNSFGVTVGHFIFTGRRAPASAHY